jgi:outer membrane receptor protein involved in Fe transport
MVTRRLPKDYILVRKVCIARAGCAFPDYQFKVGGVYRWKDRVKAGLVGTIVDDHFANANNTATHFIPAYNVWDLTAEVNFCHGRVGVFAGINNLFNEDFWAEGRDEGIVPAYRRNYYGGVSIKF